MKRRQNPPLFGSKERRKAFGSHESGSRSGARSARKKKRQAGREAATRAEATLFRLGQAEAAGKKLTKTQSAALEKATKRLQAEGALPDDAHLRQLAREHQAHEKALDSILGAGRKAYAVKVAREDRPFNRADLEAFQQVGWIVKPAGIVAAKVGRLMAALNPGDELDRILGPKGETRAVVLTFHSTFGEDAVYRLRTHGLDVSTAPKSMREGRAKVNPATRADLERWKHEADSAAEGARRLRLKLAALKSVPTLQQDRLQIIKTQSAVRDLLALKRDRLAAIKAQRQTKINPEAASGRVYAALVKEAKAGRAPTALVLADATKLSLTQVEGGLLTLQQQGLAHPAESGLFGASWATGVAQSSLFGTPPPVEGALAFNPSGHERTRADTAKRHHTESDPMAKSKAKTSKTTGRARAVKKTRSGNRASKTSSKASKPSRPNPSKRKANPTLVKGSVAAKARMAKLRAMKGKRGGKASYLKINPSNPEALARIWKAWTGSDADKTLHIEIDQARKFGLPSQVVLLGRLTWLATAKGGVKKFSADGPLLVTDAEARKVWILSAKPQKFDLEPSLIAYLARKPKFGDKNLIEYVHAFEGRAHAVMDGQVGALTGTFRVTPAGLEG